MRNARAKKIREYRKAIRAAKGTTSLWILFEREHPRPRWTTILNNTTTLHQWESLRERWMRARTKEPVGSFLGMGNAPADFRRDLNRLHRAKEKQALRKAIDRDELEDYSNPRQRRNANWLWW